MNNGREIERRTHTGKRRWTMTAYAEMWLRYCKENAIWFGVCGNGLIGQVTDCNRDDIDGTGTAEPDVGLEFGTKAAYEWLVRWHTKLKTEIAVESEAPHE